MASISNDPNGRRRILFVAGDGSRKAIRLGKVSQRHALAFKIKVEDLVAAKAAGHAPSDETARWVAKLDDATYGKLSALGLLPKRNSASLGAFTREYIDGRADIKPSTRINMDRARSYLLEHFDEKTPLREITEGDAEDFQQHMVRSGRADNTIRKAVGRIRQFFNAAKRRGLAEANPFEILPATVLANRERFFFVTREMTHRILQHCPDEQWRLIVLLTRYGGLRCPSEVLALKWSDVNWEHDRIRIPSPKTERHEGKASRTIPLFPELREGLWESINESSDRSGHLITRYRDSSANLRTQFHRIIIRAGYEPWPKVFQNLRSTRETELAEDYPLHVVTGWIGNTELVAAKHYLQLTDDHFKRAILGDAAQNPAQNLHEMNGNKPKEKLGPATQSIRDSGVSGYFPLISKPCETRTMPPEGLEPSTR